VNPAIPAPAEDVTASVPKTSESGKGSRFCSPQIVGIPNPSVGDPSPAIDAVSQQESAPEHALPTFLVAGPVPCPPAEEQATAQFADLTIESAGKPQEEHPARISGLSVSTGRIECVPAGETQIDLVQKVAENPGLIAVAAQTPAPPVAPHNDLRIPTVPKDETVSMKWTAPEAHPTAPARPLDPGDQATIQPEDTHTGRDAGVAAPPVLGVHEARGLTVKKIQAEKLLTPGLPNHLLKYERSSERAPARESGRPDWSHLPAGLPIAWRPSKRRLGPRCHRPPD